MLLLLKRVSMTLAVKPKEPLFKQSKYKNWTEHVSVLKRFHTPAPIVVKRMKTGESLMRLLQLTFHGLKQISRAEF